MDETRKNKQTLNKWLESQRGRPQYRPAPTAGMAVAKVVRPLSKKFQAGSSAAILLKHWPQIVGERWAKISTPVKFTGGKEGRTLVISAPGGAAALIMAASGAIIERLNAHMGEGSVSRIRLVQSKISAKAPAYTRKRGLSPSEQDKLQKGLANIPEGGLKSALEKLGRGVLSNDK